MMKRIFIAIDISEAARQSTNEFIQNLRKDFTNLRISWEKAEKLHLTLKFLGDIEEKQIFDLKEAIKKIAKNTAKFKLTLKDTGVFPRTKIARVLWIGLEDKNHNLLKIFDLLEKECEKIGFAKETRKFNPHLTIARLKEPYKSIKLVEKHLNEKFEATEFEVSKIVIYESKLQPTGSKYNKIKEIELELEISGGLSEIKGK